LEIAKTHVEGKTDERIEDSLIANRSRAKSNHTTLKPTKVFSKYPVHLVHRESAIPPCGYR
jgi:hypothetical protein